MKVISFVFFFIFLSNICLTSGLQCFECQDKDDEFNCADPREIGYWQKVECSGSCFRRRRRSNSKQCLNNYFCLCLCVLFIRRTSMFYHAIVVHQQNIIARTSPSLFWYCIAFVSLIRYCKSGLCVQSCYFLNSKFIPHVTISSFRSVHPRGASQTFTFYHAGNFRCLISVVPQLGLLSNNIK